MKLLNKCITCYFHYLESILNDDSFKEYINPEVVVDLTYMLKYMYKPKIICFKCLPLKYAIKAVYCFNWLS